MSVAHAAVVSVIALAMPGASAAAISGPTEATVDHYLTYCIHVVPFGPEECATDSQVDGSANIDKELNHSATSSGNAGTVNNHVTVSHAENAGGITSATVTGDADGSASKGSMDGEAATEGRASANFTFTVPQDASVSYSISGATASANKTDSDGCVSAYVELANGNDPLFTQAKAVGAVGADSCFTATTGGMASGSLPPGRYQLMVLVQGSVDTESTGQEVTYDGKASATITFGDAASEPIIFVHGFLGSRVVCNGEEAWPHLPGGLPRPLPMRLAPNGVSDLNGPCSVPSGEDGLVKSVGPGSPGDVYGSTVNFLRGLAPDRVHFYAWDWRKSPEQTVQGLDALINQVRQDGKVVLMGHSMGGLVIRWYIEDAQRAAKVARAVTVGTPYWGAPKSLFPVAAGVEAPGFSPLDILFDNDELQAFARNLQGLYFLWPSAAYGGWLSVLGESPSPLDRPNLLAYVANELGGNATLLRRALDAHAQHLDQLDPNGIDYQVVLGTGLLTVERVSIIPLPGDFGQYSVRWGDGDGTVPYKSAQLGGQPGARLHYVCGISHVPLPGHPNVTGRIKDFLLKGDPITGPNCNGDASGFEVYTLGLGGGGSASARTAQSPEVSLEQAESFGLVERLDLPDQEIIAANSSRPVTLTMKGRRAFRVTPLRNSTRGMPRYYRPVKGTVTIDLGENAVLERNGERLKPLAKADKRPPRTRVRLRIRGKRAVLTFRARDANGVDATYVQTGKDKGKRLGGRKLRVKSSRLKRIRFQSVDVFGNVERLRRVKTQ
ncbi:MAG TPA: alpha/beta fold hydrolase [Thermoleophilaceae bacterium]|nr:alpha/beta fold hydrolase [Thermoleophilaceae bacterium]